MSFYFFKIPLNLVTRFSSNKLISRLPEGRRSIYSLRVIYTSAKTRARWAVIDYGIVWHPDAKLGQKQEPLLSGEVTILVPPHTTTACDFMGRWGGRVRVLFYHLPSPSVPECGREVSFLCASCPLGPVTGQALVANGVQVGVAMCGTEGLSCSLRLLTGPARVWSPPFSSVFSLRGHCLHAVLCTASAHDRSVKERTQGLRSLAQTNRHATDSRYRGSTSDPYASKHEDRAVQ